MADDAKEEGVAAPSGKRVIGSVAAMILAIGAGILKHSDNIVRHADEFARPLGRHAGGLVDPVARNPDELVRPMIRRAGQLADVVDHGDKLRQIAAGSGDAEVNRARNQAAMLRYLGGGSGDAGVNGGRHPEDAGEGFDLDEILRSLGKHTERSLRQRVPVAEGAPADPVCDPQSAEDAEAVPAPAEDEAGAEAQALGRGPTPDAAEER